MSESTVNSQKTVLITGAAGGIGRASVSLFTQKGWHVIGVDRSKFGADFPESGLFIQSDISRAEDMEAIFEKTHQFTESLDALVNNAAVQVAKPIVETTVDEWDAVMASNLRSVFLGVKLAYPLLKAKGGAVVNISSVHAIQTSANIAAYAASKGGLLALTRAMAIEFAPDNIRVNAIAPGPILAPPDLSAEEDAEVRKATPLGRWGGENEIAKAVLSLIETDFITGECIRVDGGRHVR